MLRCARHATGKPLLGISKQFPQPGNGVVDERANRAAIAPALRAKHQAYRDRIGLVGLEQRNQGTLGNMLLDLV